MDSEKKHTSNESIKIPVKWIVSIVVILVVLILVFILMNSGIFSKTTSSDVSEKEAADKVLNFVVTQDKKFLFMLHLTVNILLSI